MLATWSHIAEISIIFNLKFIYVEIVTKHTVPRLSKIAIYI